MIAVLGVMGIVDLSGVAVPVAGYLVAALAVVAGGLVLGAWVGRSRGLIALGIVLGLAIGPAVLVDAVAGTEWRDWSNADNIRLVPQTPDQLAAVYDYGGGSFRLDLTDLDFEGEELATMIDMGAGEVIVTVPPDVDVVVDGAIVAGDLTLFDRRSSGFDASDVVHRPRRRRRRRRSARPDNRSWSRQSGGASCDVMSSTWSRWCSVWCSRWWRCSGHCGGSTCSMRRASPGSRRSPSW